MRSKLSEALNLSIEDQQSISKTTGMIRSVTEFLSEFVNAVGTTEFLTAVAQATPWFASAVAQAATDAIPPIKFLVSVVEKLGKNNDPDKLAYLAFTAAYEFAVEKSLLVVGAPNHQPTSKAKTWATKEMTAPSAGWKFESYSLHDSFNHPFLQKAHDTLNDRSEIGDSNHAAAL